MTAEELIEAASKIAGVFRPSEDCTVGSVAAVLVTIDGNVYSGIRIDTACGLGFCAEHAAVAEMLKAHESDIRLIVAVDANGRILPPCGRCRELMWQVSRGNAATEIILAPNRLVSLSDLLPYRFSK